MKQREKDPPVLDPARVAREAANLPAGTRYVEPPKRSGFLHPFEAIVDFFYRLHTREYQRRH